MDARGRPRTTGSGRATSCGARGWSGRAAFSATPTISGHYTAALAPAVAGIVGIGVADLRRRESRTPRVVAALLVAASAGYAAWLLASVTLGAPAWLVPAVLVLAAAAAGLLLAGPRVRVGLGVGAVALLLAPTLGAAEIVARGRAPSTPRSRHARTWWRSTGCSSRRPRSPARPRPACSRPVAVRRTCSPSSRPPWPRCSATPTATRCCRSAGSPAPGRHRASTRRAPRSRGRPVPPRARLPLRRPAHRGDRPALPAAPDTPPPFHGFYRTPPTRRRESAGGVRAPVDVQVLAGDVPGAGGGEEEHRRGDVLGGARPLVVGLGDERRGALVAERAPEEVGVDDRGPATPCSR